IERYRVPPDSFANFAVNAHANARGNPYALFNDDEVSAVDVLASRFVFWPLRLYDCSPICDGAAAVELAASHRVQAKNPVRLLASSAATDRFRIADRPDPLRLDAATLAFRQALSQAGITQGQIDFYEVHDAFSIMACMLLEALGLAEPGTGWRLAASGAIRRDGPYPISTLGGLKARGHPIGATALYQACEIVQQLTGCAGVGQLARARIGLLQSVGGAGTTVLSHIFGAGE
ncbi:MAG: thiolase domain-containing protein, partial [Caldilineaceae bacterium]|nr:thiolase domain-containing protein [Caldilineaceae bacterium]